MTDNVWTQKMPAAASIVPDGRYYHRVAYDPVRRLMLLFGGHVSGHRQEHGRQRFVGVGSEPWHLERDDTDGRQAAAARTAPDGVQHACADRPTCSAAPSPKTRPTAQQSSGSTSPNATARDNGAGCTAATASSCKSGNCVDGVCCVQTAAQCNGKCKSCNVPGMAGYVQQRARPASRTTTPVRATSPATRPSSARRCSAMRARRSATARAGTARTASAATPTATAPASSATWPAKVGTCSPVPSGIEDPPTCASRRISARVLRRRRDCSNWKADDRQAVHRGRAVHQLFCIDGFCCNSQLRQHLLRSATRRAPRGPAR